MDLRVFEEAALKASLEGKSFSRVVEEALIEWCGIDERIRPRKRSNPRLGEMNRDGITGQYAQEARAQQEEQERYQRGMQAARQSSKKPTSPDDD